MVKLSYSAEGACSLRDLSATQGQGNCTILLLSCGSPVVGSNLAGAWWQRRRQGRIEKEAKGVTKEERSPATSYPEQKYSTRTR